ncbi:hypothetical protein KDM41_11860 [bacterium]|nr:hypothetical protein [bacterium]
MFRVTILCLSFFLLACSTMAATAPAAKDGAPETPPVVAVAIHAGPTFSHTDMSFQLVGPTHEISSLEIEQQMGWRVRCDANLAVNRGVALQVGFGFARDRFVIREEGFYPAPEGGADPVFAKRATRFSMARVEVPLKLRLDVPRSGSGSGRAADDLLYVTMGPRFGFNLFGEGGYGDPQLSGMPNMKDAVALEIGAGIMLAGPGRHRLLLVIDYAIDLMDRFQSEVRSTGYDDAPQNTWDDLRLQTIAVSAGLAF